MPYWLSVRPECGQSAAASHREAPERKFLHSAFWIYRCSEFVSVFVSRRRPDLTFSNVVPGSRQNSPRRLTFEALQVATRAAVAAYRIEPLSMVAMFPRPRLWPWGRERGFVLHVSVVRAITESNHLPRAVD